jgi:hypothetical protein
MKQEAATAKYGRKVGARRRRSVRQTGRETFRNFT